MQTTQGVKGSPALSGTDHLVQIHSLQQAQELTIPPTTYKDGQMTTIDV